MKRKAFLQVTGAALGATLLPAFRVEKEIKKKAVRVAHLTDIHVKPGIIPETGMVKALHHVQNLDKDVDFIVNGGDAIMDALEADKEKTRIQFELFRNLLKNENSLPVYHTIGNHDIWGWFIKQNRPETDPLYGKTWAVEAFGMKQRFYSFEKKSWYFIVLDSTQLNPAGGYIGKLDETQIAWLEQQLANVLPAKHICIISHIPVLSICSGLFFNKTELNGDLMIKRNLMHTDFLALKKLFIKYPNVKVCISGHIHLQDEVDYLGVKYYCNGAVSGSWWNGNFQEFAPAYAVMDFYEDGTSKRTMINYA